MEDKENIYKLSQEDQEYILKSSIKDNFFKISCQNITNPKSFSVYLTIHQLKNFKFFIFLKQNKKQNMKMMN